MLSTQNFFLFNLIKSFIAGKKNVQVLICGARPNVKRSLMAQKGGHSLSFQASLEEAELTLKV
jgi:hypothetical protein